MNPTHDRCTGTDASLPQVDADLTPVEGVAADEAAAVLAHELRGPLAVVSGYLGLLSRAQDEHTREYALGAAQRAVARMDALIADVLESMRRPSAPQRPLAPVDPAAVVSSLLETVPAYGLQVTLTSSCTMHVRADTLRLERALANVLDNALKFSPPDARVRITLVDDGTFVRFIVDDEGPGIPPGEAQRLTRRFERLGRDSELPGYGIGLGVTVELIEGMGGEVVFGDRPDRTGARFEIALPGVIPDASD